jgi:hypothetical protein
MAYRDSGSQLLSKVLELEAHLDGLRPRIEALESAVSRLEVRAAMAPIPGQRDHGGDLSVAVAQNEIRDQHVAKQVGHLALRVKSLEQRLGAEPPPARDHDDLRALVDEELALGPPHRRR